MTSHQSQLGRIERRADGWWITGFCCQDLGPYTTQEAAQDDRRGVQRFYRETSKEKPRTLFSGLSAARGQLDLFDDLDVPETKPAPKRLPMPRKQLENAVLRSTTLYDMATIERLTDARLVELWERFK